MAENNTSTQYNKTNQMQQTFQDGVDSIYNAMVAAGATPGSKDPAGIVSAIGTLATNKYNAGYNNGYNAHAGVGEIRYDSPTVSPGQIWYIGRNLFGLGYVFQASDNQGWAGVATCAWTVLQDAGKASDGSSSMCWTELVQITGAGIMRVANSFSIRIS